MKAVQKKTVQRNENNHVWVWLAAVMLQKPTQVMERGTLTDFIAPPVGNSRLVEIICVYKD